MNCQKVRRYLPLYIDSDLSSETSFEIASHLDACDSCRERMAAEVKLETTLSAALARVTPAEEAAFDRAAARIAVSAPTRRRLVAAAAAILVVTGLGLTLVWVNRGEDLTDAMSHCHRKYLAGSTAPMILGDDPAALKAWFAGQVPFPVSVGRTRSDVRVVGARSCHLGPALCAYLIAERGDATVSVFQIEASELGAFPKAASALADGPMRTRSGPYNVVAFRDGARVVCAIGEVPSEQLDRVAREVTGS